MGGESPTLAPGIQSYIRAEFERVARGEPELCYQQLVELRPIEDFPFGFSHLATLFVLDRDKNGLFSCEELLRYAEWCQTKSRHVLSEEFQPTIQA
jgi:hypothetical protein